MSEVERVAVLGSCLTRDAFNKRFNPTWREHYDVVLSANQSSMVALMSPPIDEAFSPTRPMSEYDEWNVRSDLTREPVTQLAEARADVLVLDFFADVWFGVARLPDGRYLTDNFWKTHHTDLYQQRLEAGSLTLLHYERDEEELFALWVEALGRFADHVREVSPRTRVVVHRGWITDRVQVPGRARPQPIRRHTKGRRFDVADRRRFWDRLDEHAITTHGWDEIDLRGLAAPSHHDHPWGPFYVHFTPDYHRAFLGELVRRSLSTRLGPEHDAALALLADAASGTLLRELETERHVASRLQERLRAQRGRAPAASPPSGRELVQELGRRVGARWRG